MGKSKTQKLPVLLWLGHQLYVKSKYYRSDRGTMGHKFVQVLADTWHKKFLDCWVLESHYPVHQTILDLSKELLIFPNQSSWNRRLQWKHTITNQINLMKSITKPGTKLTSDVVCVINNALHGVKDELTVHQVPEKPLQTRLPSLLLVVRFWNITLIRGIIVTWTLRIIRLRVEFLAISVTEPHGHEPHLLGDAFALSRVLLPVPRPPPYYRRRRTGVRRNRRRRPRRGSGGARIRTTQKQGSALSRWNWGGRRSWKAMKRWCWDRFFH